jgi:hypothetical protein
MIGAIPKAILNLVSMGSAGLEDTRVTISLIFLTTGKINGS